MFEEWDLWRTARLAVGVVVLVAAAYYLVVAFDNITNPHSNWVFVRGVLSLDGVPANSGFGWRAIDSTFLQAIGYVLIIAGETVAGLELAWGGLRAVRATAAPARWAKAQRVSLLGCLCGLLVFWFGFIVVGGNWWVMYLNAKWNGLEPAFQNATLTALTAGAILAVAAADRGDEAADVAGSVPELAGASRRLTPDASLNAGKGS